MMQSPQYLWLLLLLLPFVIIVASTYKRISRDIQRLSFSQRSSLLDAYTIKSFFASILFALFLVFLVISLTRYMGHKQIRSRSVQGLDVVFLVDVSNSMLASDVAPTRLRRAAALIQTFTTVLEADRYSITAFRGSGTQLLPLTEDALIIKQTANRLSPALISSEGSNFYSGLMAAKKSFLENSEAFQVIILFSDGELLDESSSAITSLIQDSRIPVYTVGIGTVEGSFLQIHEDLYVTKLTGERVISRLNEAFLKELALQSSARYVHVSDPDVVAAVRDDIAETRTAAEEEQFYLEVQDGYRSFLVWAIVFLFLYIIVKVVRWGRVF